jgi:pectate lyase
MVDRAIMLHPETQKPMNNKKQLLAGAVLTAVLAAQVASAQLVTNTVTVRNTKGMGVKIVWGTGAISQTYDKAYVRNNGTTDAGKAWIQFDLSNAWATYGRSNLVSATLTLWGENGPGRSFDVAGLADSTGLENWDMSTLTWSNAPANNVATGDSFDWSKVYGGAALWLARSGGIDLARPDLGTSFDQCARYTSPDLSVFLATDTDGKVTFMGWGGNNQNWWVGTNGTYANDISLGYTSTNTSNGTFGDVIRDSPTLTLTFVAVSGPASAPVFTNVMRAGANLILQGSNGPPNGAYQMLRSTDVSAPSGNWLSIGVDTFDTNGNFSFASGVSPEEPENFYRLLLLSLVGAPKITVQPPNPLNVVTGQTANFSVTAEGAPPLRYQWYYNTNTVLTGRTNTTLTLTNVQLTDAGQYSVTVTNLFGTTNSIFAKLIVSTNSSGPIGWASVAALGMTNTTGGGNATPILATSIAHLKSLASDGTPRVIQLSGTYITGNSPVEINNNKTLVGLGTNAIIQGGINVSDGHSNIIVRNINIQGNGQFATTNSDGTEIQPVDSIAVRASHHLWFDHLNVSDGPDGNLDLTVGTDYVTVSWCKFWYTTPTRAHRLSCLIGNGSTATTDTNKNNVTYHHNWFAQGVQERMPRILFGKCHVFNSYYNSTNNNYCVGVGSFASVRIENNSFQGVEDCYQFVDSNHAYITAAGNMFSGTSGKTETGLGGTDGPIVTEFIPSTVYPYTPDAAADVPSMVTAGAGPQ